MNLTATWIISLISFACVMFRPWKIKESVWALAGAALLICFGLISIPQALRAVGKGTDVYLFLFGMMLLAETAREQKLFDWLAAGATRLAHKSGNRFFLLVYMIAIVTTAFLSNDATVVVLTPAVAAATRAAQIKRPLPFLLICAFVANAASFIFPISNPANLIIYQDRLPPLLEWLRTFLLPSVFAIAATFFVLRITFRRSLPEEITTGNVAPPTFGARITLLGIFLTAVVLLCSSALNVPLGLPTAIAGMTTTIFVLFATRQKTINILNGISWQILFLVAGLFVIVEALSNTGLTESVAAGMTALGMNNTASATWITAAATAVSCNIVNNLPAGLIASAALQSGGLAEVIHRAVLIGIDLGPNISVPGSLATILWVACLRREGIFISGWQFFKIGLPVTLLSLLFAILSLWI